MATRQEMINEGYVWYCLGCNMAFKKKPTENYEDGHRGRQMEMCHRCGSDLFDRLDSPTKKG